jgi:hypothetical protein
MRTIAVIGSAGRKDDARHMDRTLYDAMYEQVLQAVSDWGCDAAVSGGAALADHLAVRAYLEGAVGDLLLFLPARFEDSAFVPNPRVQFNPGATGNTYHRAFSRACGIDSLGEISEAIARGARVEVHEGFHRRNLEVADKADTMLALTFGGMEAPVDIRQADAGFSKSSAAGLKDGGTAFHGLSSDDENRRKVYDEFGPDDEGFRDSRMGGLRDGGTAHTWTQCWRAETKRHVNLFRLQQSIKDEPSTLPIP